MARRTPDSHMKLLKALISKCSPDATYRKTGFGKAVKIPAHGCYVTISHLAYELGITRRQAGHGLRRWKQAGVLDFYAQQGGPAGGFHIITLIPEAFNYVSS